MNVFRNAIYENKINLIITNIKINKIEINTSSY